MEFNVTPAPSENIETPISIKDSHFIHGFRMCPKCGRQKGLPVTHNEEPDADQLPKIQRGELLWIRLSMLTNGYRIAINWKCIWCEFEWRERRGPFY